MKYLSEILKRTATGLVFLAFVGAAFYGLSLLVRNYPETLFLSTVVGVVLIAAYLVGHLIRGDYKEDESR